MTKNVKKGNPSGFAGLMMLKRMKKVHKPLISWAMNFIAIKDNMNILDAGFGGGNEIKYYLKQGKNIKVTGVDISPLCFKVARFKNLIALKKKRLILINDDIKNIDFKNETFDLVTAFSTFRFWDNKEESLSKIYNSLKTNGTFMIADHGLYDVDWTVNYLKSLGFNDIKIHHKNETFIALVAKK